MNILKYIFICIAGVLAAASCNENKEVMTPEAVVETFCRTLAAGDFNSACALCDTASMMDYIENYRNTLAALQKIDSSSAATAASILSGAEFEVTGTGREGEEKTVRYVLKVGENTKNKQATVRKEEGEWRVTSITDRI